MTIKLDQNRDRLLWCDKDMENQRYSRHPFVKIT